MLGWYVINLAVRLEHCHVDEPLHIMLADATAADLLVIDVTPCSAYTVYISRGIRASVHGT